MRSIALLAVLSLCTPAGAAAQNRASVHYTRADTLRGSKAAALAVDGAFYVTVRNMNAAAADSSGRR